MPVFSLSETLDVMDNLESAGLPLRAVKAYMRLCNDGPLTKKSLAARFKQTETAVAGWLRALVRLGFVVEIGGVFRVVENFFSLDYQSINVSMPIVQEKTNGTEKDVTPREAATEPEINFSALAEEAAGLIGRGVTGQSLAVGIRNAWNGMKEHREHFADLVRKKAEDMRTAAWRKVAAYFYQTLKNAIAQREWEPAPEFVPVAVNAPDEYTYQRPARPYQRQSSQQYRRPSNVFLQREKKDDKYYDHIYAKFSD